MGCLKDPAGTGVQGCAVSWWTGQGGSEIGEPSRVWGARGTLQGLGSPEDHARFEGVYRGMCCQHPKSGITSPQGSRFRAAAMGQGPFPLLPRRGPQDPGPAGHWWDRTSHWDSGAAFTGPCASLSGDRVGAGSLHFHSPWTVISTLDRAPRGAASRRGLVLTTAPFVSHQAGFLGLF